MNMSSSDSELNRGEIIIYSPNNNIRIEGAAAVCYSMKRNTTLTELKLDGR